MTEINSNGWPKWSVYVRKELERLNECYERLDKKIDKMNENFLIMRLKVTGIGAVVSLIVTAATLLIASAIKGN